MLAILSTGGTILSKAKDELACYDYKPSSEALDELLKSFDTPFELVDFCNIDSSNMTPALALSLAKKVNELSKKGFDKLVILHGSDTMEESAFFLDMLKKNIAVVFTGAMRPSSAIGFEGLKNLHNAVLLVHQLKPHDPVMVCMNDDFFTASGAVKTHSLNPAAFSSINFAKAGYIKGSLVQKYYDFRPNPCHFDLPGALGKVALLYLHVGFDARLISCLESMDYEALVLAGYGSGTIEDSVLKALKKTKLEVILSTRVLNGGIILNSEFKKLISAGVLSPNKARLLASLCLGSKKELKPCFDSYNSQFL